MKKPEPKRGGIDLGQLAADAIDGAYPASRRIRQAIERLDNNNLVGLIETVLQTKMMTEPRERLVSTLLAELRNRDIALFLEWAIKAHAALVPAIAPSSTYAIDLSRDAIAAFRDFVVAEPAKAEEWAAATGDSWVTLTKAAYVGDTSFQTLMAAGFLRSDQKRAFALLSKMPVEKCVDAFHQSAGELDGAQMLELAIWASTQPDAEKRRTLVREVILNRAVDSEEKDGRLVARGSIIQSLGLDDDDIAWIATRWAVDSLLEAIKDAEKVPQSEFDWLASVVSPEKAIYAKGAAYHLYQPSLALTLLNREIDQTPSDNLIAGYVESEDLRWKHGRSGMRWSDPAGGRHGDTAFRLSTRINDPARRMDLLTRAWTDLHNDSAKAAAEILAIPELSIELRIAPILKKKP